MPFIESPQPEEQCPCHANSKADLVQHGEACLQQRSKVGAARCTGGKDSASVYNHTTTLEVLTALRSLRGQISTSLPLVTPCLPLPGGRFDDTCKTLCTCGRFTREYRATEAEKKIQGAELFESISRMQSGARFDCREQFWMNVEVFNKSLPGLDKAQALMDTGSPFTIVTETPAANAGFVRREVTGPREDCEPSPRCLNGQQLEILGKHEMWFSFPWAGDSSVLKTETAFVVPNWDLDQGLPSIILGQTLLSQLSNSA